MKETITLWYEKVSQTYPYKIAKWLLVLFLWYHFIRFMGWKGMLGLLMGMGFMAWLIMSENRVIFMVIEGIQGESSSIKERSKELRGK